MRSLIISLLFVSVNCFGQNMPDIDTIDATINGPNYIEHSSPDSAYFRVGRNILVNVLCEGSNQKPQSSGIIRHSYYNLGNFIFKSAFYITDTTIVRSLLYYEGSNTSDVLNIFNLERNDFTKIRLFTRYYSIQTGSKIIRCWLKRRKVLYEEQLIE